MGRPETSTYTVKELSTKTWSDFLKLFSQGAGWDHCACVHFHRACSLPKSEWLKTRAERAVRNRRVQKDLIARGESHGVLVYVDGEAVGWCQYGEAAELPRFDNSVSYQKLFGKGKEQPRKLWRISCFVVDRKHWRRGIAGTALQAALEAIKSKGGGVVEGFPLQHLREQSFGNASTHGTVSMFAKAGFKVAGPYGNCNVVMRRTI